MWKYLAIIKDSFREALSSRVMWLVLALISLLLLAVAPLGYREVLTWQLGDSDVREWPDLMVVVRDAAQSQRPSPARQLWLLLDGDLQKRLSQVKIPGKDPDAANPFEFLGVFRDFRRAVNQVLREPQLYDPAAFEGVPLVSNELRELRDRGLDQLQGLDLARFNRLLLEASFPEMIRSSPPTSIQMEYGWMDVGAAYPLRGETLRESLQSSAVTATNWFLGVIGVLVAILVTAPIIPQMFDSGSLHLLLSKPISRSLLFLAKYLGGCVFILIAAAYLIGGLWLVLGMRFGVWQPKLLLSIPIYLFVFAIYYAVASLAGVIWRSAIVSIALTVLFWLACFLIGTTKATFEMAIWNKSRLIQLTQARDTLLAVNEMGLVQRWDASGRQWEEVFVSPDQRQARAVLLMMPMVPPQMRPVGPLYDAAKDRLVSVQPSFPPPGLQLYVGRRTDDWEAIDRVAAPLGTWAIFQETGGAVLLLSPLGMYRLERDPAERQESLELFGFQIPLTLGGPFLNVSPDPPLLLSRPSDASRDPVTGRIAVYARDQLLLLELSESGERYQVVAESPVEGAVREPAVIAAFGGKLLLGREDGRLQLYRHDSQELILEHQWQPEGRNQPRFLVAAQQNPWVAVVYHNGQMWLCDLEQGALQRPDVSGQGEISAAAWTANGELLVADQMVRVSRYRWPAAELVERYTPKLELLAAGYRYGLLPLYTLFPKPGELDKTIDYLLSGRETERLDREDLTTAQQEVRPWAPVISSGLFTLAVLLAACCYLEWQDF